MFNRNKNNEGASNAPKKVTVKNEVPRNDRVLLIRDAASEKTSGGLYIPPTSMEKYQPATGKIYSVDPSITTLKKDDHVLFHKDSGIEITLNTVDYLLLHVNEILMTYEQTEADGE